MVFPFKIPPRLDTRRKRLRSKIPTIIVINRYGLMRELNNKWMRLQIMKRWRPKRVYRSQGRRTKGKLPCMCKVGKFF